MPNDLLVDRETLEREFLQAAELERRAVAQGTVLNQAELCRRLLPRDNGNLRAPGKRPASSDPRASPTELRALFGEARALVASSELRDEIIEPREHPGKRSARGEFKLSPAGAQGAVRRGPGSSGEFGGSR
jgi:hypothetical protein